MSFDEEFTGMLKKYPDAVQEKKKFSALLKDFFHGHNMRINLLCAVYDMGIVPDMQKTGTINNTFAYRYVKQMMDDYGVNRMNADWAVAMWCVCYGANVLRKSCDIRLPKPGRNPAPAIKIEKGSGTQYADLFTYSKMSGGYGVTGFSGTNRQTLVFSSHFSGKPVTQIMDGVFKGIEVQEAIMTGSIEKIGACAFMDCTFLKQVVFSPVLREIGDQAFCGCTSLSTAVLPPELESIGRHAFFGALFKEVRLPTTMKWIGEGAFENNVRLTSIVLPKDLVDIQANVFRGCVSLSHVKLAEHTEKIGTEAFRGCSALTSILIPESVQQIGEGAFSGTADKFTVQCYRASYAEEYARRHSITYQLIF